MRKKKTWFKVALAAAAVLAALFGLRLATRPTAAAAPRYETAQVTRGRVAAMVIVVNLGLGLLAWLAQSGHAPDTAVALAGIVVLTVLYLAIERRRPMEAAAPDPTLP